MIDIKNLLLIDFEVVIDIPILRKCIYYKRLTLCAIVCIEFVKGFVFPLFPFKVKRATQLYLYSFLQKIKNKIQWRTSKVHLKSAYAGFDHKCLIYILPHVVKIAFTKNTIQLEMRKITAVEVIERRFHSMWDFY